MKHFDFEKAFGIILGAGIAVMIAATMSCGTPAETPEPQLDSIYAKIDTLDSLIPPVINIATQMEIAAKFDSIKDSVK